MPKCAGSSVHAALTAALPDAAVAAKRFDATVFCAFDDFDALAPMLRALVAVDDQEVDALADCDLVSGHFSLPSLRRIAEPSSIATLVREPRARLLSLYAYWRLTDCSMWAPYAAHEHAQRPLVAFLAEPSLAPMIDDQLVRLVLHGDPLLPPHGFIPEEAVPELAERTLAQLDELAFVGLQELPRAGWAGLSRAFGVELRPQRANVVLPSSPDPADVRRTLDPAVRELLGRRTAVTRRVYAELAARALDGPQEARRFASSAFIEQLSRFERSFPGTTLARVRPRRGLRFRSAWTPARRTPR